MRALKKWHHGSLCPQVSIQTIPENNLSSLSPKKCPEAGTSLGNISLCCPCMFSVAQMPVHYNYFLLCCALVWCKTKQRAFQRLVMGYWPQVSSSYLFENKRLQVVRFNCLIQLSKKIKDKQNERMFFLKVTTQQRVLEAALVEILNLSGHLLQVAICSVLVFLWGNKCGKIKIREHFMAETTSQQKI